jgi:two-component system LytT family response regulator
MNAIIIDDELKSIENLKALLKMHCPFIDVIGFGLNASEGKTLIQTNSIDLLFLDIQMPDKSGFDLLGELPSYRFQVIFVTAFDNYAIKAIKYSALDYILKPINTIELIAAVRKAQNRTQQNLSLGQIEHLIQHTKSTKTECVSIGLQLLNEIRFVRVADIIFCQSENNYTIFRLASGEKIVVSKGLYEYEGILPEGKFIRCHQSYIINKGFVKSLKKEGPLFFLKMTNDCEVPVSRAKKEAVKKYLLKI